MDFIFSVLLLGFFFFWQVTVARFDSDQLQINMNATSLKVFSHLIITSGKIAFKYNCLSGNRPILTANKFP